MPEGGWADLFRSLGESLLKVLRAELAAVEEDFRRSSVHLKAALGLLGGVAVLGFWIAGLLIFALVSVLHLWLPLWAAALIVMVLFAIVAAVLGKLAVNRLRRIDNPVASVKQRVDNHLEWWQQLLAETKPVDAQSTAVPAAERNLP
ncbi:MAG TPA: phage holin family protein [Thermoanaerobaculia bacterium]|nr:phage holin family protein [Thermoanaerobaculia bacterium]